MDAVVKPWPKPPCRKPLSDHVRAAPQPVAPKPSREEALAAVRTLIAYAGDNPDREGPARHPQARDRRLRGALPRLSRMPGRRAGAHLQRDRHATTISCWCATSPSTPIASIT